MVFPQQPSAEEPAEGEERSAQPGQDGEEDFPGVRLEERKPHVGVRRFGNVGNLHRFADRRLEGCGLAPLNAGVKNPLPWLAEMMDIKKEQNFFEGRVTEYQKSSALQNTSDDDL